MPTGVSSQSQRPHCPRCGYDQTGLIESWKESCPLIATCAECGYGFDPADAIYPTRRRLPWLYEHAKHWWSARSAIKTLVMLAWPPAFWRRVRPEHEVRPRAILAFFVLPYLVLIPLLCLIGVVSRIMWQRQTGLWNGGLPTPWPESVWEGCTEFLASFGTPTPYMQAFYATQAGGMLLMLAICWLPSACAFLVLSSERSGTPLRRVHLVRVLAYSATPFLFAPVVIGFWSMMRGWYEIIYDLLSPARQAWLPNPWDLWIPDSVVMSIAVACFIFWPAIYWFSAIRLGYSLPSTMRPFLIILAVILTPWALFLGFFGYYEFIA